MSITELFENSPPPVVLRPAAERKRTFAAHVQKAREAVRARKETLLNAYRTGIAFNYGKDQRVHELYQAEDEVQFFQQQCEADPDTLGESQLYKYGRIARYLEQPWIVAAAGRVKVETAAVIVRPHNGVRCALPWPRDGGMACCQARRARSSTALL